MSTTPKPGTSWRCTKCDTTVTTALPAKAVLCPICKRTLGTREQWMHNDD